MVNLGTLGTLIAFFVIISDYHDYQIIDFDYQIKEWVTKDAKEAGNCPILSLNDACRFPIMICMEIIIY